ncbi:Na(+)/H(+) antiporter NhaA [Micromonospora noduli]|uniref:Na(+)/H(+) antiporter NhaA n=1 Tax=Micromonospora noduli TaxID=709876 RepID=A0ABX9D9A3_9ACTN|nr:Na+/H+ antiporter NhaA [Micromonospora noduli]RAO08093.1 Na(+)/H(+) antiporter NhaA [Micromonospora noduli]RAO25152.1 Na(+)/H(+) antiporter NhaA [Micromonospora noduli]RAO27648.1 Na(+)/H(+) antiporter NhaA [Micromonospora noduli]
MTETKSGRTIWKRNLASPLWAFLRIESGSAGILVAAIVAALFWANIDLGSYEAVWRTQLSLRLGHLELSRDLQTWINSGLMTLFFLVVGLEARREFDLGDLRDRRRFVLPSVAGLIGMLIPVLIFLGINHGGPGAHGWGVAMSTDTALALGLLALLGRGVPDRVRIFLLTVFVVDDVIALIVIALVYSEDIRVLPIVVAVVAFAVMLAIHAGGVRRGWAYVPVAVVMWGALLVSGVDPVVTGLAIGLTAFAYSPGRSDLEKVTGLFRSFREQPTPTLARTASIGLANTLSPNDRLQRIYHPWSSYVIVPLFGLANAGISIDRPFLAQAFASPVTWGVLLGYVVGKPLAVIGTSAGLTWLSHGRIRPAVGWAGVLGSGTIAGVSFTVSLLVASLAFTGDQLAEAKVGVLSAAIVSSALTWVAFRVTNTFPQDKRVRALFGDMTELIDLTPAVDEKQDHVRGPAGASVTLVQYGDFQCPYCGKAEPVVRQLLGDADLRFVWRHLPLSDVHPQARLAAEGAEAAAAQGKFWQMHDLLLDHQGELDITTLIEYADDLGLDQRRFHDDLTNQAHAARIDSDIDSADNSGVSGTPTFFINGRRHYGAYDITALTAAIRMARARARLGHDAPPIRH